MENKKLIDTHAHLLKEVYEEFDLNQIIKENLDKIEYIFNISWNLETSKKVIALNKEFPKLLPVIGIHPNDVEEIEVESTIKELEKLIIENKIYAIGEIGIDLYRSEEGTLKKQKLFLGKQLELGIKHNLPIVLHIRDAYEEALEVLVKYPKAKLLVHSWNSNVETLEKFLNLPNEVYFGINGIVTFKNAKELNSSIKSIPLDKLVIETDSPWLTPSPNRSIKPNQPIYVKNVFEYLVLNLEIDENELSKILLKNSKEFFNLES